MPRSKLVGIRWKLPWCKHTRLCVAGSRNANSHVSGMLQAGSHDEVTLQQLHTTTIAPPHRPLGVTRSRPISNLQPSFYNIYYWSKIFTGQMLFLSSYQFRQSTDGWHNSIIQVVIFPPGHKLSSWNHSKFNILTATANMNSGPVNHCNCM